MKETGISRPVDRMGRIVIPKEIRDTLNLQEKDRFYFFLSENDQTNITLKQVKNSCILCNSKDHLKKVNGKFLCENCIEKISNK